MKDFNYALVAPFGIRRSCLIVYEDDRRSEDILYAGFLNEFPPEGGRFYLIDGYPTTIINNNFNRDRFKGAFVADSTYGDCE